MRIGADQEERLLSTVLMTGPGYRIATLLLLGVVGWAGYAFSYQLRHGLGVTGMHDQVPWGLYIVAFVFFSGLSMAGTLISAILRLTGAEWRRPITRLSEVITVIALLMTALMPILDMGLPHRVPILLWKGRLESPLLWDIIAISTYLAGSMLYLYLPLIPDLALLRDRLGDRVGPVRRWFYRTFALGWRGTAAQHRRLERVLSIMAVMIIPIGVSVHSVVSWIFAMTVRPGWHSTIFAPYFVVGAIFSGIAGIITAMAVFRKIYRLESFITQEHFVKLGYLLLTLNLVYLYFSFAEYLTVAYVSVPKERYWLELLFRGDYAQFFWLFASVGLLMPILLIALPWTRTIAGITIASVLVNVGMWLKRFVIVVPSLVVPQMQTQTATYQATWVEISIVAGGMAGFVLLYITFARYLPIISVWEMAEGAEQPERPRLAERPLLVGEGGGAHD